MQSPTSGNNLLPPSINPLWNQLKVGAFSFGTGVVIAVGTQPFYVAKILKQQGGGEGYPALLSRAVQQRGVLGGLWNGLVVSAPKSGAKQGVKGSFYAITDGVDIPPHLKSVLAAAAITGVMTPMDRVASAFIGNSTKSKMEVLKGIGSGGLKSVYRGGAVDFVKNLVEAGVVFGLRATKPQLKKALGCEGGEISWLQWAGLTGFATGTKLLATNWLDVSKAEIQKHVKSGGAPMTVGAVLKLKGLKHFFFAGIMARMVMNYAGMAGSLAALELKDHLISEDEAPQGPLVFSEEDRRMFEVNQRIKDREASIKAAQAGMRDKLRDESPEMRQAIQGASLRLGQKDCLNLIEEVEHNPNISEEDRQKLLTDLNRTLKSFSAELRKN